MEKGAGCVCHKRWSWNLAAASQELPGLWTPEAEGKAS